MSRCYDMDGQPITLTEWCSQLGEGVHHVGLDVRDDVAVSTVWLGINHNYGDGLPLIFETLILGGDHDAYQERYATKAEALEGHQRALAVAFGVTA